MKKTNLTALAAFMLVLFTACQQKGEPVQLFNGNNLDGWTLYAAEDSVLKAADVFTAADGVIRIKGNPFGFMYTDNEYGNFELHAEWSWADGVGTNSGIFLFVQPEPKLWPNAIECQLHKGDAGDFVLLGGSDLAEFKIKGGEERPEYPVVKKQNESSEKPAGEWNQADIVCKDGSITVTINGVLQNKGQNTQFKKGRIGFQSEGGEIEFKNVILTPLK